MVDALFTLTRLKSTLRCLASIIPFYLFLPTLVAWFSCYAVARFWDITWGNRPTGGIAVVCIVVDPLEK